MSYAHQRINENSPQSSFSLRSLRFIYIGNLRGFEKSSGLVFTNSLQFLNLL